MCAPQMLKQYVSYIEKKNIPYYWNKKNNLIGNVKPSTLENIVNRLKRMIEDIEKKANDPYVVAKYLRKCCVLLQMKRNRMH